jgi:hypothetical protein
METLESEKGTTPARRAISASPSCQCIASAARQGTAISSATFDHISGLNLKDSVSILESKRARGSFCCCLMNKAQKEEYYLS